MPETVRLNLDKLIQAKQNLENRRIYIHEIALDTGISDPTLSRIYQNKTKNVRLKNLILLCKYFKCDLDELVTYKK
jgi:putative transcriptional regulator